MRSLLAAVDAGLILLLGALVALINGSRIQDFSPTLDLVLGQFIDTPDYEEILWWLFLGSVVLRAIGTVILNFWEFHLFTRASVDQVKETIRRYHEHMTLDQLDLPLERKLFTLIDSHEAIFRDTPRAVIAGASNILSAALVVTLLSLSNPTGVVILFFPLILTVFLYQKIVGRRQTSMADKATDHRVKAKTMALSFLKSLEPLVLTKKVWLPGMPAAEELRKEGDLRSRVVLASAIGPQIYLLIAVVSVFLFSTAASSYLDVSNSLDQLALLLGGFFRIGLALAPIEESVVGLRSMSKSADFLQALKRSPGTDTHSVHGLSRINVTKPEILLSNDGDCLAIESSIEIIHPALVHVTGRSGAGKTSLLRGIANPSRILSGEVSFLSDAGSYLRPKISLIPSDCALLDMDIVGNIVAFSHDESLDPDLTMIKRALQKTGLYDELSLDAETLEPTVPLSELSLGQKYRLHLASSMISRPDILLIDEIYGHLDDFSRKVTDGILKELLVSTSVFVAGHHFGDLSPDFRINIP